MAELGVLTKEAEKWPTGRESTGLGIRSPGLVTALLINCLDLELVH